MRHTLLAGIALLLLSIAVLLLSSGCAAIPEALPAGTPVQVRVELDVYSGRPNPTWPLSEAQAQEFLARLAALPVAQQSGEFYDGLGYRGFIVHLTDSAGVEATVRIYKNGVSRNGGQGATYATDSEQLLERWLLQTSDRSQVGEDLFKLVTQQPAQAALPADWRSYTAAAGGYAFACPEDWEVQAPPPMENSLGPGYATALIAPAARYPGGNSFAIRYNDYAIAPGQSLSDWYQQVFLASQDGMIAPRGTQAVEALPMTLPGVRGLLVTELMGSNPFWHRHKVYLTHDEIVLELLSETTAEHSASTVRTLRELAATVRFLPDAPRLLTDVFEHPHAPQLAEVVATATAQAVIAQTPECDLTCRDATAWATVSAGITPGSTLTYAPAMATDEARYIEMVATATAAALTTTPTPPPSATPAPAPRPASQVGQVLYEGERLGPAGQVQTRFAVAYAPDEWALTGDDQLSTLTHRQLPHCALKLQPGGWGVGGPVVSDSVSFAGLTWRTTYWLVDGWMTYWPQREGLDLWFALRMDRQATAAEAEACRTAAEAVLQTLTFTNPTIQNNIFINNAFLDLPNPDYQLGGGLYNSSGNPQIRNNIFASNTCNSGGGLFIAGGSPVADHNDMWNNTGGDYAGIAAGPHDLAADPLFVDAAVGDFHLAAGSPCIDAGDPIHFPATDFEGDLRPEGAGPDIGADEFRTVARTGHTDRIHGAAFE